MSADGLHPGELSGETVLPDGRWFKASEMACHDEARTPYPPAFRDRWLVLCDLLYRIRDAWGGPINIVSGYRTPEHNGRLLSDSAKRGSHGVASSSQHVEGRAADICPATGPSELGQLWRVIKAALADGRLPTLGGYAYYPVSGWIHVDCRDRPTDGHVATWVGDSKTRTT